jgi:rubrerythrin
MDTHKLQEINNTHEFGFHIEEDFTEESLTGLKDLDSPHKCSGCGTIFTVILCIGTDRCPFCQTPMKFNTSKEYLNASYNN